MTQAEEIIAIGQARHGERWKTGLAMDTGWSWWTFNRIEKGKYVHPALYDKVKTLKPPKRRQGMTTLFTPSYWLAGTHKIKPPIATLIRSLKMKSKNGNARKNRVIEMHDKINELAAWCKGTKQLHISVRFYPDNEMEMRWCVRVCPNGRGMAAPICTRHGSDLEAIAAEALEMAKPRYEQQKASIIRTNDQIAKHRNRQAREEFREIEAMHHTASDF